MQYRYINVDHDPGAAQWVKQQNAGIQKTPTVDIEGQILVEPDERDLESALRGKGLVS